MSKTHKSTVKTSPIQECIEEIDGKTVYYLTCKRCDTIVARDVRTGENFPIELSCSKCGWHVRRIGPSLRYAWIWVDRGENTN